MGIQRERGDKGTGAERKGRYIYRCGEKGRLGEKEEATERERTRE